MKAQPVPMVSVEALQTSGCRPNRQQLVVRVAGVGAYFFSYGKPVAVKLFDAAPGAPKVLIDPRYYTYSSTTGRYRCQFLGELIKETERKLRDGTYESRELG